MYIYETKRQTKEQKKQNKTKHKPNPSSPEGRIDELLDFCLLAI